MKDRSAEDAGPWPALAWGSRSLLPTWSAQGSRAESPGGSAL